MAEYCAAILESEDIVTANSHCPQQPGGPFAGTKWLPTGLKANWEVGQCNCENPGILEMKETSERV